MQRSEKAQTTTSGTSENERKRVSAARAALREAAQEDEVSKGIRAALQEAAQKAKRRK